MLKLRELEIHPDDDAPGGALVALPDHTGEDGDVRTLSPREVIAVSAYLQRIAEEAE